MERSHKTCPPFHAVCTRTIELNSHLQAPQITARVTKWVHNLQSLQTIHKELSTIKQTMLTCISSTEIVFNRNQSFPAAQCTFMNHQICKIQNCCQRYICKYYQEIYQNLSEYVGHLIITPCWHVNTAKDLEFDS